MNDIVFNRENYRDSVVQYCSGDWAEYRKVATTQAIRINGPFSVQTREGLITSEDGYLAVDAHGWPYPIAADEFEKIYTPVAKSRRTEFDFDAPTENVQR